MYILFKKIYTNSFEPALKDMQICVVLPVLSIIAVILENYTNHVE